MPEVLEGTWEEISRLAPKFNGHRLRVAVTILPDNRDESVSERVAARFSTPTGRFAARVRAERSEIANAPATTPEEVAKAQREMRELINNLNENRRSTALILFSDSPLYHVRFGDARASCGTRELDFSEIPLGE
jgi:hypothetical protein